MLSRDDEAAIDDDGFVVAGAECLGKRSLLEIRYYVHYSYGFIYYFSLVYSCTVYVYIYRFIYFQDDHS